MKGQLKRKCFRLLLLGLFTSKYLLKASLKKMQTRIPLLNCSLQYRQRKYCSLNPVSGKGVKVALLAKCIKPTRDLNLGEYFEKNLRSFPRMDIVINNDA